MKRTKMGYFIKFTVRQAHKIVKMVLFAFLAMASAFWGGFSFSDVDTFRSTTGGGVSCAACTIVLSLSDQYINLHNVSADQFINNEACALFPAEVISVGTTRQS